MYTTLNRISALLGGSAHVADTPISILLTDSRSLTDAAATIFFAITTKSGDGHRFIGELYEKGVRAFVVSTMPENPDSYPDALFIKVDNPVAALQKVGSEIPPRPAEMVAITGSRGKTTLKEWLFQLLEPLKEVVRSPRSYNSRIGVPLSLWEIDSPNPIAIIEAGISHRGEMQTLADIIRPDTVIFTNISAEHSEGFTDNAEKAREKAILASLPTTKTVIYDADSPLICEALKRIESKEMIGWSRLNPEAPLYLASIERHERETVIRYRYRGETGEISIPFTGDHDIDNSAAALAFMLHEGFDKKVIAERFAALHPIGTRLNVSEGVNGCTLVYDSYTSDYGSLLPALDFTKRHATQGQKITLILSDLHHESYDGNVYLAIARLIENTGIDRFIGIGPSLASNAAIFGENARFFKSTSEFLDTLSPSDFSHEIILFKGSAEYPLHKAFEALETRKHETVLEVNLDAIVKNYNYFRRHLPSKTGIIAMVKASGYGAGSYEVAKTMQSSGAAYLAVAVLDEGIELRQGGITMPIMVMNPKVSNYKAMFSNSLEPEIYSFEMLEDVIREARKNGVKGYPVHIKLDTGMHRMGFIEEELPELADLLLSQDNVKACSLFSHLATADCPDMDDYTLLQLDRFRRYTDYLRDRCGHDIMRHVLNSAGILRFPEHHYELARLGIGLYGANTLPASIERPLAIVSALRTVIISIRHWKAGESIGYGRKGMLDHDATIATIPIGYADGMNRHFGNGAISVLVGGKEAPTVGNICMDACMIDVTGIDCNVGDSVEIFGPNMPLQRLADTLDTIPYEILTAVSPRVKRIYYRE